VALLFSIFLAYDREMGHAFFLRILLFVILTFFFYLLFFLPRPGTLRKSRHESQPPSPSCMYALFNFRFFRFHVVQIRRVYDISSHPLRPPRSLPLCQGFEHLSSPLFFVSRPRRHLLAKFPPPHSTRASFSPPIFLSKDSRGDPWETALISLKFFPL